MKIKALHQGYGFASDQPHGFQAVPAKGFRRVLVDAGKGATLEPLSANATKCARVRCRDHGNDLLVRIDGEKPGSAVYRVIRKGKRGPLLQIQVLRRRVLNIACWLVGSRFSINEVALAMEHANGFYGRQASTVLRPFKIAPKPVPAGVGSVVNFNPTKGQKQSDFERIIEAYATPQADVNLFLVHEFVDRRSYPKTDKPIGRRYGRVIFIDDSARQLALVLAHEIGHSFGLEHSFREGHIMYSPGAAKKMKSLGIACDVGGKIGKLMSKDDILQINLQTVPTKFELSVPGGG